GLSPAPVSVGEDARHRLPIRLGQLPAHAAGDESANSSSSEHSKCSANRRRTLADGRMTPHATFHTRLADTPMAAATSVNVSPRKAAIPLSLVAGIGSTSVCVSSPMKAHNGVVTPMSSADQWAGQRPRVELREMPTGGNTSHAEDTQRAAKL